MTGGLMLADRLTDVWAGAMWRASWQGGLGLGIVWAWCRLLGPRTPARVKCWLWRLAYAKLLLSLVWTAPAALPLLPARREPSPEAAAVDHLSTAIERQATGDTPALPSADAPLLRE